MSDLDFGLPVMFAPQVVETLTAEERMLVEERVEMIRSSFGRGRTLHAGSFRCGHGSTAPGSSARVMVECSACHSAWRREHPEIAEVERRWMLDEKLWLWDAEGSGAFDGLLIDAGFNFRRTPEGEERWVGCCRENWREVLVDLLRVGVLEVAPPGNLLWGKI